MKQPRTAKKDSWKKLGMAVAALGVQAPAGVWPHLYEKYIIYPSDTVRLVIRAKALRAADRRK